MKVLYLAHHALGDLVMKMPAIHYLIHKFGKENTFLTVRDETLKRFLVDYSQLDESNLIVYHSSLSAYKKLGFVKQLQLLNLDYFIIPPTIHKRKGKVLFRFSSAKKMIASHQLHTKAKSHENYYTGFKHKVYQNIEFIRFFESWADEKIIEWAKNHYFLSEFQPQDGEENYFVVHPGSGVKEKHKRYPEESWIELLKQIRKEYPDTKIFLCGMGQEAKMIASIKNAFIDDNLILDKANQFSLTDYIRLIDNCRLFISADCGPAHLASIVQKNMVTIFGPTDFEITGPFTNSFKVNYTPELSCMPCYGSTKYGISGCNTVDCMNKLNPNQVMQAISYQLKN